MSQSTKLTVGRAVDWQFAATVGVKLARPGPAATDYTRRQVIEQLAEASRNAELSGVSEGGLDCHSGGGSLAEKQPAPARLLRRKTKCIHQQGPQRESWRNR